MSKLNGHMLRLCAACIGSFKLPFVCVFPQSYGMNWTPTLLRRPPRAASFGESSAMSPLRQLRQAINNAISNLPQRRYEKPSLLHPSLCPRDRPP